MSSFRSKARILAYIDFVLTILCGLYTLIYYVAAIGLTVITHDPEAEKAFFANLQTYGSDFASLNEGSLMGLGIALFIAAFIMSLLVILQFVAVIKLLNATQIGLHVDGAAKGARFWRNVTMAYLFVEICLGFMVGMVGLMQSPAFLTFVCVSIAYNCVGIYIVHKFILELELQLDQGPVRPVGAPNYEKSKLLSLFMNF